MFYFLFTIILIYTIFKLWFAVSAYREMEPRAGRRGLMATAGLAAFLAFYALAQANGLLTEGTPEVIQQDEKVKDPYLGREE